MARDAATSDAPLCSSAASTARRGGAVMGTPAPTLSLRRSERRSATSFAASAISRASTAAPPPRSASSAFLSARRMGDASAASACLLRSTRSVTWSRHWRSLCCSPARACVAEWGGEGEAWRLQKEPPNLSRHCCPPGARRLSSLSCLCSAFAAPLHSRWTLPSLPPLLRPRLPPPPRPAPPWPTPTPSGAWPSRGCPAGCACAGCPRTAVQKQRKGGW